MKVAVIIAAAGKSRRFGGSDKLAQDLGGRPLLNRTVEIFTKRSEVGAIIVAGPPDEYEAFKDRYGATLGFHGAVLVRGGRQERWETVRSALSAVPEDCTHIAVHDAARPAVDNRMLDRIFEAARELPAVIPVVAIASTVKRVSDDVRTVHAAEDAVADSILGDVGRVTVKVRDVLETVDRAGLVEVQTPQVFEADLLRRAYAQADLSGATDDASLIERLGEKVYTVEGESTNIKVTTSADLALVRAILGVKPPAERPVHMRF